MKKFFWLLFLSMMSVSCSKPDEKALLNSVCDGLRGKYLCYSIIFQGDPIDINGDGIASTDLLQEFKPLLNNPRVAIEAFQRIYPASDYDKEMSINLDTPLQNVNYDKWENRFFVNPSGSYMYVCFSYRVDESGKVTFGVHNEKKFRLLG